MKGYSIISGTLALTSWDERKGMSNGAVHSEN